MAKKKIDQAEPKKQLSVENNPDGVGISLTKPIVEKMIEERAQSVLNEAKNEINKQAQTIQTSLISIFGLFALIISFLTIEFQFLKTLYYIEQIVGFTLILWSLLLSFGISLGYLINNNLPKLNKTFCGIIVLLFAIGTLFIWRGCKETYKTMKLYNLRLKKLEDTIPNKSTSQE